MEKIDKPIFKEQIITYQEVIDGMSIGGDDFGLVKKSLSACRVKTFLSNPFLEDKTGCLLYIQRADGIVVGNNTIIPSKFKAGNQIIDCGGGSNLVVVDRFRKYGIGAYHILYPINNTGKDAIIYAELSTDAINAYRAIRFYEFRINKYWQFRKSRFLFEKIRLKGFVLTSCSVLFDLLLKVYFSLISRKDKWEKYSIKKVEKVPDWIDDIVLNDGHKYMEVHNHQWMQWCLDNMFYDIEGNKNVFYIISINDEPMGFFFLKYRVRDLSSYNKPKLFCSIMEWGSKDESLLSEADIYEIAQNYIDNDVDIIEYVSNDIKTKKRMKKYFSVYRGDHYIVFKDVKKKYKEAMNPSLWRLRFGYSDSIFNQ